ncbi:MAG: efflux RND transporter periplasmic adaptor subunit [Deltaproteobacteria bacterium]|nr:efflux RND transporter periplasmic adaptor subunit [Deltaproteobacteria bacterium]
MPVLLLLPEAVQHRASFQVSGTLRPAADVQLAFKVGGTLARLRMRRGQQVDKGAALLQLDERDAAAGVAQAEAAVQAAEAQAGLARDAVARLERLRASGNVSEFQLTEARLKQQMAEAQLAQTRAALLGVQLQLDHHTLRSPLAGTVLQAPDTPGMIVGPGVPLVEVADLRCLRLQASLPAEAAGRVVEGSPVELTTREGEQRTSKVTLVLPALDPRSHRLPVETELCDEQAAGLANSFVQATLLGQETQKAHRLPVTALVRGETPGLFLLDGEGRARFRAVEILARQQGWVVLAGLTGQDRVIDLPPEELKEGAMVQLATRPGR